MRTLSLLFAATTVSGEFVAPWFCHGINCPEYTPGRNITVAGKALEVRKYAAGQYWTSTDFNGESITEAQNGGFSRLFDYISGDNVDKKKIDMTSPVRTAVRQSGELTVSFYVPWAYQPNLTKGASLPPKPSKTNTYTSEDKDAVEVAVYSFSGYATDENSKDHAAELAKTLKAAGVSFDEKNWYLSCYDPPFRVLNRHNEIWIQLQ